MLLDKKLDKIRDLADQGKEEAAFVQINELIALYPNDPEVWSLRSSLYAKAKNYDEALSNISKAIEISPEEASFHTQRGRYHFRLGNDLIAVKDFSDALLTYNRGDISLIQHIYFFRAESFIKLGKKQEALLDISHIPDNFQIWTFKLRSKADLIADCDKI